MRRVRKEPWEIVKIEARRAGSGKGRYLVWEEGRKGMLRGGVKRPRLGESGIGKGCSSRGLLGG